jgi:hypothetical protein
MKIKEDSASWITVAVPSDWYPSMCRYSEVLGERQACRNVHRKTTTHRIVYLPLFRQRAFVEVGRISSVHSIDVIPVVSVQAVAV